MPGGDTTQGPCLEHVMSPMSPTAGGPERQQRALSFWGQGVRTRGWLRYLIITTARRRLGGRASPPLTAGGRRGSRRRVEVGTLWRRKEDKRAVAVGAVEAERR